MKKWPLNSVTLPAATHSKLRKALDGTGTQVVTCMINKWMVKMNGVERYITIEVSQRRGRPIIVLRTLESSDREALENREEEELILGPNTRIRLYPFSMPLTIPLPYDPVRSLKKPSLRPSFWAHFSTKFIVLGLLGLGLLTSTVKDLPNQDPTGINCNLVLKIYSWIMRDIVFWKVLYTHYNHNHIIIILIFNSNFEVF